MSLGSHFIRNSGIFPELVLLDQRLVVTIPGLKHGD